MIEFDQVDAAALAEAVGTPAYVLSPGVFRERLDRLRAALESAWPRVACFYSMKANANPWVLREALAAGWGLDACSQGDLFLADEVGAAAEAIAFTGVGLDARSLAELRSRVGFLNVDHLEYLRDAPLPAGSRLGLRLVPVAARDSAGKGDPYTTRKFGLTAEQVPEALRIAKERGFVIEGLHCHPGVAVMDVWALHDTLAETFNGALHARDSVPGAWDGLTYLNIGGGLGVSHDVVAGGLSAKEYAEAMRSVMTQAVALAGHELALHAEPGEWVVTPAGALLTRVLRAEVRDGVRVAVVDASFNQYMSTSFYGFDNEITVVGGEGRPSAVTDVFGRTNHPADRFCLERDLPEVRGGDLLVVHGTGGYGYSRGARFNEHPQAPEVFVSGSRYAVAREREDFGVFVAGVPAELGWLEG